MRGECSGNTRSTPSPCGDAAHGRRFVKPATLPADRYARKNLDSFLVSFHHAGVHAHAIANRKRFGVTFYLFLNRIDDLIHKLIASTRGCGRTLSNRQTQFANGRRDLAV